MVVTSHARLYDAFGEYVRSQRHLARLTLRQAAEMARISNPYLSQIEHGLALPSIAVISSLSEALSVSVETMLLRAAGVVSPCTSEGWSVSEDAIRHDPRLDESQKAALLAVLSSFVGSSAAASPTRRPTKPGRTRASVSVSSPISPKASPKASPPKAMGSKVSRPKTPGRPATAAAVSTRRKRT